MKDLEKEVDAIDSKATARRAVALSTSVAAVVGTNGPGYERVSKRE